VRKQAQDELDAHVAAGDLPKAARALLKEHWRAANGKAIAPEAELDAEAVGNLRDALEYFEAGDYVLAAHHAWRFQCILAKRGRLAGIEHVDEQGVWQCIEMCQGAAEARELAIGDMKAAQRERDQHQAQAARAALAHAEAAAERDAAKAELLSARAELGATRSQARTPADPPSVLAATTNPLEIQ
jgi:hypothetical protein